MRPPRPPPLLLSPLLVATLASPAAGGDAPCVPATEEAGVASAPSAWRAAVARLVRSTGEPGHPWSCGGGSVDLRVRGETGVLIVLRRGDRAVERDVATPDDVVPTGQALLSLPREPVVEVAPPPPQSSPPPVETVKPAPAPAVTLPRLVLGGRLGPRIAGGSDRAMVGAGVSAAVPIDAWLPTVWSRYDRSIRHRGGVDELSVGAALFRGFAWSSFDVRAGVTASAAVMQRDLPRPAGRDTRVDGRVGVTAGVAVPFRRTLRWVVIADAELAPGRSREAVEPNTDGATPMPFPFFTVGVSIGAELSL